MQTFYVFYLYSVYMWWCCIIMLYSVYFGLCLNTVSLSLNYVLKTLTFFLASMLSMLEMQVSDAFCVCWYL
jgi:hypothetical protein